MLRVRSIGEEGFQCNSNIKGCLEMKKDLDLYAVYLFSGKESRWSLMPVTLRCVVPIKSREEVSKEGGKELLVIWILFYF